MNKSAQLRQKLIEILKELFQLDKPDLDFGFYRIMHAKAKQVEDFLNKDLLSIVEIAFGTLNENKLQELQEAYNKTVAQFMEYTPDGDPQKSPKVQEAKAKLDAFKEGAGDEADVYDHLCRFFQRYYEGGDFISRRYYTKESADRAAVYSIPYSGEEVKLHWANADQYYIKSSEYFSNFTVELKANPSWTDSLDDGEKTPSKLHFKVVSAEEGEHNNVKSSDNRCFVIDESPVEYDNNGELTIRFQYVAVEKGARQAALNKEAVDKILPLLEGRYRDILSTPAPTESDKERTVLAKYIASYTSRNSMDYFIHKDLKAFLLRELDFYIKNEIMELDDLDNADEKTVAGYLSKIKVIRRIAGKIIEFLGQLEDFQKKLWLKKKFVTETNYCITLDRVPEELYAEIAANEAQIAEWVKLFAIDEIKRDIEHTEGFTRPLSVEFLKENQNLLLDTKFFSDEFKTKLLESIHDLDEQCDGLLIHSENFQALNLLQERYREQVKCIYIDPPYNTAASEIIYKNSYKHSSWISLMNSRLELAKLLMNDSSVIEVAIDDFEFKYINLLMDEIFGISNVISNIAILTNPKGREQDFISQSHDYSLIYAKNKLAAKTNDFILDKEALSKKFSKIKDETAVRELPLKRTGTGKKREERPFMFFPFIYDINTKKLAVLPVNEYGQIYNKENGIFNDTYLYALKREYENKNCELILPISEKGEYLRWRWGYDTCVQGIADGVLFAKQTKNGYSIYQYDNADDRATPKSLWLGERYDASTKGTNLLDDTIPNNLFDYPKSIFTVMDNIHIGSDTDSLILDYFAGSGTTGHAVINLNREDEGKRKYILVEMGNHFDTVLKPRISKVIYANDWKDGKPQNRNTGISHCFKYIRLETYEDTLNNLDVKPNDIYSRNKDLYEEYMLKYMLDVDTHDLLLNIASFNNPDKYTLKLKKPNSDEYQLTTIDLIETFNYLIGLRVSDISAPQHFTAEFHRPPDPELPKDTQTRLAVNGAIKTSASGEWWFRRIEGELPVKRFSPNDGDMLKVLIIWRNLTDDRERDNLMLNEYFKKLRIESKSSEYDLIYVNGDNNLRNISTGEESWKVLLIEEEFMKEMWS